MWVFEVVGRGMRGKKGGKKEMGHHLPRGRFFWAKGRKSGRGDHYVFEGGEGGVLWGFWGG